MYYTISCLRVPLYVLLPLAASCCASNTAYKIYHSMLSLDGPKVLQRSMDITVHNKTEQVRLFSPLNMKFCGNWPALSRQSHPKLSISFTSNKENKHQRNNLRPRRQIFFLFLRSSCQRLWTFTSLQIVQLDDASQQTSNY